MELDIDLYLLAERGSHGASQAGDGEAGERATAASSRVAGPAAARALIYDVLRAAADSGWGGGGVSAEVVDPDSEGSLPGRSIALRSGIGDARMEFPGADPERLAGRRYPTAPDGAVEVGPCEGGAAATVRYLSSGPGANAGPELLAALRGAGVGVSP